MLKGQFQPQIQCVVWKLELSDFQQRADNYLVSSFLYYGMTNYILFFSGP